MFIKCLNRNNNPIHTNFQAKEDKHQPLYKMAKLLFVIVPCLMFIISGTEAGMYVKYSSSKHISQLYAEAQGHFISAKSGSDTDFHKIHAWYSSLNFIFRHQFSKSVEHEPLEGKQIFNCTLSTIYGYFQKQKNEVYF